MTPARSRRLVVSVLFVLLLGAVFTSTATAQWTVPAQVSDPTLQDSRPVAVATDGGGRVYAMSSQRVGTREDGMRESVVSSAGALLESRPLTAGNQGVGFDAKVSVDPAGDALFGWTREPHAGTTATRKAQIRERFASGKLGAIFDASDISTDWDLGDVGLAGDGTGLVSMIKDDGSAIAARPIAHGGALGLTESVATLNPGDQELAEGREHVFPNGDALFTFVRVRTVNGEPADLLQARFRRADGTWGATRTISNPALNEVGVTITAADSEEHALVIWAALGASGGQIKARRITFSTLGPTINLTPSNVDAHPLAAQLSDDGSAVIAWSRPSLPGQQDEVEWVNPDNTHTPPVSPGPQATNTGVVLNGADSSWLEFQVPGHADEIRSFSQSGALGARESVPEPAGASSVDTLGSAVASSRNGELAVETGYFTGRVHGGGDDLVAVAIRSGP